MIPVLNDWGVVQNGCAPPVTCGYLLDFVHQFGRAISVDWLTYFDKPMQWPPQALKDASG